MGVIKKAKRFLGIGTRRYSTGTKIDALTWLIDEPSTKDLSVAIKRAEKKQKANPSKLIFVTISDTLYGFRYADGMTISTAKRKLKQQQLKKKSKMKKPKKYWK